MVKNQFNPMRALVVITEDEVVWSEELSKSPWAYAVHCPWFQVYQHCPWDILVCCRNRKDQNTEQPIPALFVWGVLLHVSFDR